MTHSVASSTLRILGAEVEKSAESGPPVYRIERSMAAVHFGMAPKGRIVFLPKGAELYVVGPSPMAGCQEVLCGDRLYNVFSADLLGAWSVPIRPRRRNPVPSLQSVAVCA
jgi:hypothetical protein